MGEAVRWGGGSVRLVVHVVGYSREVTRRGYAERTVLDHARLIAELDRWMVSEALALTDLTPERLKQFVESRRWAGYRRLSHRRFKPFLDYMHELESVPIAAEPAANAIESLIAAYQSYLEHERGLMPTAKASMMGAMSVAAVTTGRIWNVTNSRSRGARRPPSAELELVGR